MHRQRNKASLSPKSWHIKIVNTGSPMAFAPAATGNAQSVIGKWQLAISNQYCLHKKKDVRLSLSKPCLLPYVSTSTGLPESSRQAGSV